MDYKQKIYLTLVISVLIVIGLLLFLTCPLINRVKLSAAELRKKISLASSYQEKAGDYLKWLRNEYTSLESEISEINKSFINPEEIIDFILAVEQIAALTNNYQEIKKIDSLEQENVLSFQISLWGNFPNLIKFLAQLENMDCFVDNSSFQIARIGERDLKNLADKGIKVSTGDVKSILEIKAYAR